MRRQSSKRVLGVVSVRLEKKLQGGDPLRLSRVAELQIPQNLVVALQLVPPMCLSDGGPLDWKISAKVLSDRATCARAVGVSAVCTFVRAFRPVMASSKTSDTQCYWRSGRLVPARLLSSAVTSLSASSHRRYGRGSSSSSLIPTAAIPPSPITAAARCSSAAKETAAKALSLRGVEPLANAAYKSVSRCSYLPGTSTSAKAARLSATIVIHNRALDQGKACCCVGIEI